MSTVGEQVLERITELEGIVLNRAPDHVGQPVDLPEIAQQLIAIRNRLDRVENAGDADRSRSFRDPNQNPKDWMPNVLGDNYRDLWRKWSYKARDWLSQFDATLPAKLERVESMTGVLD